MAENSAEPSKDSLGLDLDSLKISDDQAKTTAAEKTGEDREVEEQPPPQPTPAAGTPDTPSNVKDTEHSKPAEEPAGDEPSEVKKPAPREKKTPYVNPERVKTGGAQRTKLSEDELAERMARIREQNEKIKQRRADVEADEQEFKKAQEEERQKQARNKKVQESVNNARQQNARRKLDKIQNREWDSGKPGVKGASVSELPTNPANQPPPQSASIGIRGGVRGGRGRGRGRGRGGGPPPNVPSKSLIDTEETPVESPAATPAPAAQSDAPSAANT